MIIHFEKQDKLQDRRYWADRKYRNRTARIYVWPKNETIWENLENRRIRPYTYWKKHVIPTVLKGIGVPADAKIRWSRKAGCSCGCSPGFILDEYHTFDVHVTVEGDLKETKE